MSFVHTSITDSLAVVRLERGKVNAINEAVIDELAATFESIRTDAAVNSIVLTGTGPFFSFGFDIPELYEYSRDAFTAFLRKFTELCRRLFVFPKPIVASVNGHAIAGGCILATACDFRVMLRGKAKISLNELTFGSTIFQSAIELLRYWVGSSRAEEVVFGGRMYPAGEACNFGLVDAVVEPNKLSLIAARHAEQLGRLNQPAFAHAKSMLRQPIIDRVLRYEEDTIAGFVEIWYSKELREGLQKITIRD